MSQALVGKQHFYLREQNSHHPAALQAPPGTRKYIYEICKLGYILGIVSGKVVICASFMCFSFHFIFYHYFKVYCLIVLNTSLVNNLDV